MAGRQAAEDSDEEFQEIQYTKLQNNYRHAREDQREYTIEKKDQLRVQRWDIDAFQLNIWQRSLFFGYRKTLEQLTRERDELEKTFRLAESLENQKRDEEKTRKLQDLVQTKGKPAISPWNSSSHTMF